MATLITNTAVDMTSFDVSDFKHASVTRTDTTITAVGTQYTYTITGTGFGTGSGLPSGGNITGLEITGADGTDIQVTGANVDVFTLGLTLAFGGDFMSIESLLLGGDDTLSGSTGADHLFGFAGNDSFDMSGGGNDNVAGMEGNDTFDFGAKFSAKDIIDGGNEDDGSSGSDTVLLNGNYKSGVTFNDMTMTNVETISLHKGHDYKLTTADATVATGATLTVDGSALGAGDHLTFKGGKETDGSFVLKGGAGADSLTGGANGDTLKGGLGADTLNGGAGKDHYVYTGVAQSNGASHDTVVGFDFKADKFDLDVTVKAIDANVAGNLNAASFDGDLATLVDAGRLGKHHAVLVSVTGGDLAGHEFLVVDANGKAGYQAGHDYVIELDHATHLGGIGASDFI